MDEVQKSKEKEEENKGGKEEDEHVDFVMGDVAMVYFLLPLIIFS